MGVPDGEVGRRHVMTAQASADLAVAALEVGALTPELLEALNSLSPENRTEHLENRLLHVLVSAKDQKIRNASALALADIHSELAPYVIRDLLRFPGIRKNSATLLYALREMKSHIDETNFTASLMEGSAEAQEEALNLLEQGLLEPLSDSRRMGLIKFLEDALEGAGSSSREVIMRNAIDLLSQGG